MSLYDKLNLVFKFLFLAVFTYGVISLTCCKKNCNGCPSNQSAQVTECCKAKNAPMQKKCGINCQKPCCKK